MAKGRTTLNGYGWKHRQARKWVKRIVEAGQAFYARCGGFIAPGEAFDLDHSSDRSYYLGPSHPGCNRGEPNKRRRKNRVAAHLAEQRAAEVSRPTAGTALVAAVVELEQNVQRERIWRVRRGSLFARTPSKIT
jgi:hypothetical protein